MLSRLPVVRSLTLASIAGTLVAALGCRSATEPAERVFILDVAASRAPCIGSFPQQCLQVRERTDAPYGLFYAPIQGFTFEPGYRYMLQVGERSVANPPADGSSKSYRLIAVVSKTPASP